MLTRKSVNTPQVVTRVCINSGSKDMAQNLNDRRLSHREITLMNTHVKPHNLDPKTLAEIRDALRKRDLQQ